MLLYRMGEKLIDRVLLAWNRSPDRHCPDAAWRAGDLPEALDAPTFHAQAGFSSRSASPKDPRSARRCAEQACGLQRAFHSTRGRRVSPTPRRVAPIDNDGLGASSVDRARLAEAPVQPRCASRFHHECSSRRPKTGA